MDAPDLIQTRLLLNKRSYSLAADGVQVSVRSFLTYREFKISYEAISDETYIFSTYSKFAFWFFVGLLTLGVGTLILLIADSRLDTVSTLVYFVFAIPFGVRFFISRVKYLGLHCTGQTLLFYSDNPSSDALADFIKKLQERRRNFIEAHFVPMSAVSIPDQLEKLARLKQNGAINDDEYDLIKKSIIEGAQSTTRRMGF